MNFKFEGGKELEAALAELGASAGRRTAERALKLAAQPIRDEWERLVPVDQGDLKRSIKIGRAIKSVQRTSRGQVVKTFVGIDESQNRRLHIYAEVQEFGSETNPAQPAGRPAWESQKMVALERLTDDVLAEIKKTAERAARKTARLAARSARLDANADALRTRLVVR
jgi:HK97 gp10 family phage protein